MQAGHPALFIGETSSLAQRRPSRDIPPGRPGIYGRWAPMGWGCEELSSAKMPPVNQGLLDGKLASRQHDGERTDLRDMKYFHSAD